MGVQSERVVEVSLGHQVLGDNVPVNRGLALGSLGSNRQPAGELLHLQLTRCLTVGIELESQVECLGVVRTLGESHRGLPCGNAVELGLVLERKLTSLPVVLNLTVSCVNPRERDEDKTNEAPACTYQSLFRRSS